VHDGGNVYEKVAPTFAANRAVAGVRNLRANVAEEPTRILPIDLEAMAAEKDSWPKVKMRGNEVCGAANSGAMSVAGVRLTKTWAAVDIAFSA
jgi:hypothetical protein